MFIENEESPLILYSEFIEKEESKNLYDEFKNTLEWKQDINSNNLINNIVINIEFT